MREIKFRAWGVPPQEWDNRDGIMLYNFYIKSTGQFIESIFMKSEDVILMQYTGLKDKNGKEIYESDILEWREDDEVNRFIVIWDFNGWRKKFLIWPDNLGYNIIDKFDLQHYEIIGNIYENPDLLN